MSTFTWERHGHPEDDSDRSFWYWEIYKIDEEDIADHIATVYSCEEDAESICQAMSATEGIKYMREIAEQLQQGNKIMISPTNLFGMEIIKHFGKVK